MSYEMVNTPKGNYLVDWQMVYQIMRSYMVYTNARSEMMVLHEDQGAFLPTLKELYVPWKKVRGIAHDYATTCVKAWKARPEAVPGVPRTLEVIYQRTQAHKAAFRDEMARIQTDNSNAIHKNVDKWGTAIETAKVVRDTSFTTVCIGATIVGGPAGVALAAAGSSGKGLAKFQDTKNVGAAVMEATGSFVTTVIPIGKAAAGATALKGAEKVAFEGAVVMIEATFDTAGNMIEGDSLDLALTKTVVTTVGGAGIGKALDAAPVKKMIRNSAIPVSVKWLKSGSNGKTPGLREAIQATRGVEAIPKALAGVAGKKYVTSPAAELGHKLATKGTKAFHPEDAASGGVSTAVCSPELGSMAIIKVN